MNNESKLPTRRSFGSNLRDARERAGLSQAELARRLGWKRATPISYWERTGHLPQPKTIREIARALGVAPAVLMADVETEYDVLRGSVRVIPPDEPEREDWEVEYLDLLRAAGHELRSVHREMLRVQLRRRGDVRFGAADGRVRPPAAHTPPVRKAGNHAATRPRRPRAKSSR